MNTHSTENKSCSGDGPESSRRGEERSTRNVWGDGEGDDCPKSLGYPENLTIDIKHREERPMSNQSLDNDKAEGSGGYPGRSPSPGAASRVILEGPREDAGLTPRKKRKKNRKVYEPLWLRDDAEEEEETETLKKDKLLRKRAWAVTADVIRDEKDAYIIFTIRDFVIYTIFLSLLLIVAYGSRANAYNYYASVLSDLITESTFETSIGTARVTQTYKGVRSITQLWDFVNEIFIKVLYMDPIKLKILEENIFVGTPAIRLIRMKKDTCVTAPLFHDLFKTCYDEFSSENEDKEPFGELISSPWSYSRAFEDDSAHGFKADYSSGGYIFNFSLDANFTINWLAELKENNWIGPGSRAVIIDFVLYTPNTNLFLVVKLLAEVLPEGGVRTSHSFLTNNFIRYLKPHDYFVMSCEFMFFAFACYYALEEFQQVWLLRRKYLANWWNILDLMIIVLSFSMIYTCIYRYKSVHDKLGETLNTIGESDHISFDALTKVSKNFMFTTSYLLFLVWVKLFKFATLNRSVILLSAAISQVKWELLTVTFTMLIIIAGFSVLGLTIYGSHVDQFRGITNSFFSVSSLFVGRLYYITEMHYVQPKSTIAFIVMYSFIVGVIFLSTYVALVVYGYQSTHLAHDDGGIMDQQYMGDLLYSLYITILTFFGRYRLVNSYRMRNKRHTHRADYDAFATMLKRYGWTLKELRLFLKSYRLYRGEQLEIDELVEIYNDFWLRNQLFVEVEAHNKIREKLKQIDKIIEFCEQAIVDIMSKTDMLADKTLNNSTTRKGKV